VAGIDGVAVVDKEAGWTSHDVVAKARGLLGTRKVGHSGTLDPDATGVLLLGVGRVTRLLRFLTALPKTYTCEVVLGVETDTLDDSGEVTARHDMAGTTFEQATAAAATLTGDILQVPPMVSAVRVGGRRLHELAREGIEVERAPRPVTVHRFELAAVPGQPLLLRAEVTCSSGTYVRTLAADLGQALGGGAHLRQLRRTAIGSFGLDEATPLASVALLEPAAAMRDYPSVVVGPELAAAVGVGKVLPAEVLLAEVRPPSSPPLVPLPGADPAGDPADGPGPWGVLDADGALLAVYERHRQGTVKPAVVVVPAGGGEG
jgi:tRNA pseudouridine55 synthase